jgi:hypothetical protein
VTAIATISGGEGSWRAAKLWRWHNPGASMRLVFTDTLYEDADTYRFLIESAADVLGRQLNWKVPAADDFPDYRVPAETPIEEYAGNPDWRAFLAQLREETALALPELAWLVEGRDPWEIFRDERYLGNTRADPCSKIDKRQMLDQWRDAECDRARDVILFGIGEHEKHRFESVDAKGRVTGIKPRLAAKGWTCAAPLIEYPAHPIKDLRSDLYGIRQQRLYGFGYSHGNCGGFCIKAGMEHYRNRRRAQPDRFAYDALMERKISDYLGNGSATILRLRRAGRKTRPLSLIEFGQMLDGQPEMELLSSPGDSGCGCMIDTDDD